MSHQPVIGIISPGDMCHSIGAVLHAHGLRVITNLVGRSIRTTTLAAEAGIIDVGDNQTLVREADILLSILVPAHAYSFAESIAEVVRATSARTLFVECNAIAPRTVQAIEQLFAGTSTDIVDVGIIGSPPQVEGTSGPRFYVSGAQAEQLVILNAYGLDIRVLGPHVGQASGLKMCYASLTKGLTALATEALTAGQALGLTDALFSELQFSQSTLLHMFKGHIPSMPPKAYRWVGEMEEIARTFSDLGLPPQMLEGAAAVYRLVEQTELGNETPEERHRGQSLEDVIAILAAYLGKS